MPTLGEYLRERREARGLSLADIEAVTRIKRRFLAALEEERWDELPGEVYARAFLRSYARCTGLDEGEVLARYRALRERVGARPDALAGEGRGGGSDRARWAMGLWRGLTQAGRAAPAPVRLRGVTPKGSEHPGRQGGARGAEKARGGRRAALARQWPWALVGALAVLVAVQAWSGSRVRQAVPARHGSWQAGSEEAGQGSGAGEAPLPAELPWLTLLEGEEAPAPGPATRAPGVALEPDRPPAGREAGSPEEASSEEAAPSGRAEASAGSVAGVPGAPRAGSESGPAPDLRPERADGASGASAAAAVRLDVRARAASWVRVKADGRVVFAGTLAAGQSASWSATRLLQVHFGRPEAVELAVNGKDLGRPQRAEMEFAAESVPLAGPEQPGPALPAPGAPPSAAPPPEAPGSPPAQPPAEPGPPGDAGPAAERLEPVAAAPHAAETGTEPPDGGAEAGEGSSAAPGP